MNAYRQPRSASGLNQQVTGLRILTERQCDHRRLDVTLISDSVPGLAAKLRAFTELIRDLP